MGFNDEFQDLSKEGTGVLADLSFPLSTPGIQNILIPRNPPECGAVLSLVLVTASAALLQKYLLGDGSEP